MKWFPIYFAAYKKRVTELRAASARETTLGPAVATVPLDQPAIAPVTRPPWPTIRPEQLEKSMRKELGDDYDKVVKEWSDNREERLQRAREDLGIVSTTFPFIVARMLIRWCCFFVCRRVDTGCLKSVRFFSVCSFYPCLARLAYDATLHPSLDLYRRFSRFSRLEPSTL